MLHLFIGQRQPKGAAIKQSGNKISEVGLHNLTPVRVIQKITIPANMQLPPINHLMRFLMQAVITHGHEIPATYNIRMIGSGIHGSNTILTVFVSEKDIVEFKRSMQKS